MFIPAGVLKRDIGQSHKVAMQVHLQMVYLN